MLYIKFTKDYFEEFNNEEKFPKIVNKIVYFYKIISGKFFKKMIDNGELIVLPRINKKIKKNLINYLKLFNIRNVCISENLYKTEIIEDIEKLGIKIIDGKFVYKHLINNIVEYIVTQKGEKMDSQEISILVNNITEVDLENIKLLCENCKNVNVITDNELRIKKLEKCLYNEQGIILNITNNYSRALLKSGIIINMNFEEEKFNKFSLPRKAIIINVENPVKVLYKGFDGINISSYKIIIPKKYISKELNLEEFNKEVLYESFVYKKTNPKNIIKQIKLDNVKLECLIGINGEISKNEYPRLHLNKS